MSPEEAATTDQTPVYAMSPFVLRADTQLQQTDGQTVSFPSGTVFRTGTETDDQEVRLQAVLDSERYPLSHQPSVQVAREDVYRLFMYDAGCALNISNPRRRERSQADAHETVNHE